MNNSGTKRLIILLKYIILITLQLTNLAYSQNLFSVIVKNSSNDTVVLHSQQETELTLAPKEIKEISETTIPEATLKVFSFTYKKNNKNNTHEEKIIIVATKKRTPLIDFNVDQNNKLIYETYNTDYGKKELFSLIQYSEKQKQFIKRQKNLYNTKYSNAMTLKQKDSLTKLILKERHTYLTDVIQVIRKVNDTKIAYDIFESEILNAKALLSLGKSKVAEAFGILNPTWIKTEIGQKISDQIAALKSNMVGATIQNFEFLTKDLRKLNIFSLTQRSKYTLIIFTAKWCGACKEQIPVIKSLLHKMKSDLTVIYISIDRSIEDWEEGLNSNYPGLQTINLPPFNFSIDLKEKFGVNYIPQVFLIDNTNRILYDNLSPYSDDNLNQLKQLIQ